MSNSHLVEEIKAEFRQGKGDAVYEAILPEGPPPIPDTGIDKLDRTSLRPRALITEPGLLLPANEVCGIYTI